MRNKITLQDFIYSYFNFIESKNLFVVLARYRRTFRHPLYVMLKHALNKYPIKTKLRGGHTIQVANSNHLHSLLTNIHYNVEDDAVALEYCNRNLKIYQGIGNGDILGIFRENCYRFLPAENRIILDIGTNIADSAIYFACRGAAKVIAVEPYLRNFSIAKKNIEINNLSDKIELLLSACSNKSGNISVKDAESSVYISLETQQEGNSIKLVTLDDLIQKYRIDSAVLKMDCEGSEYPIIMSARNDTLKRFTHIQLEYHYGYRDLFAHLTKCGFKVSISKPTYRFNKYVNKRHMYVGWIYAERIDT